MRKKYPGSISNVISERESIHSLIAKEAASEGIVLLENNGILPLDPVKPVAVYGGGARYTIIGGTGSGSVNNRKSVSIDEGMRKAGFHIASDEWLDDYDKRYQDARKSWMESIYQAAGSGKDFDRLYRAHATHPFLMPQGADIVKESEECDTAIYIISRTSGEGADRKDIKGDYYLSDMEENDIRMIAEQYKDRILVLNVGGIIDLSILERYTFSAVILLSQAGMEGGNAFAEILAGVKSPSGRLTDSWAYRYLDYPSSAGFSHNNGNVIEEKYTDGIFVGYRYFDSFGVKVRYPFGHGLSYTIFSKELIQADCVEEEIQIDIKVTNTGEVPGKEVLQIYAACPSKESAREVKRLAAFCKTGMLTPQASEVCRLKFPIRLLETYHTGTSSYYMEKGIYYVMLGDSVRDCTPLCRLHVKERFKTEKLSPVCPLLDALKEIKPDPENIEKIRNDMEQSFQSINTSCIELDPILKERTGLTESAKRPIHNGADHILSKLTITQKAALVCGQPSSGSSEIIGAAATHIPGAAGETTSILEELFGIESLVMADGPAGLRLQKHYEENPEDGSIYTMSRYEGLENRIFGTEFPHKNAVSHYQFCTAIPIGTCLAQTFNVDLMYEVGEMIGREMQEFGVNLWLAPGMNLHRNPLCGRNFEYYSEDPLVSGKMAAAITKGVQQNPGCGTTIKHFACNNQEENRRGMSSIVSERALRELYLKGFEIAVKEAQPKAVMTSYNKVNGVHTANSYDLCTQVLRNEWGFQGIVMSDWLTTNAEGGSSAAKCMTAGNDLVMPGNESDIREIVNAVYGKYDLYITEQALDECAKRILNMILSMKQDADENIS